MLAAALCLAPLGALGADITSEATQTCLECHVEVTPGIVEDWKTSRHSRGSLEDALKKPELQRRVSVKETDPRLKSVSVGCAECHTLNPDTHRDTFDHEGESVHPVVSPADCSTCHPVEKSQYSENIMAHAFGNLTRNPVFQDLVKNSTGPAAFNGRSLSFGPPTETTKADSCLACHGTEVKVTGAKNVATDFGEMEFPVLAGWPNQGVGRVNPDGTLGSCTSCHPRHSFSLKVARSPDTCSQCHKGPDVPAYKVYSVSKHGNIHAALKAGWDFDAVPWTVGRDFTAPTCAACHISLVAADDGSVVARRTHRMNDRLPWRLFGLIYAHPHPVSPDTTIIKNASGQPLPASLTGEFASKFLIDDKERAARTGTLKKVCLACHAQGWTDGHFARLDESIATTNRMVLESTKILLEGYRRKKATQASLFDEPLEKIWVEQWLFYANSTRMASAMAGTDYGAFDNGRWHMHKGIVEMLHMISR